eukprot:gnl/MRDRNA2_/MRDRNA2_91302_c0_seq1.p1 gnl/MRDRNA2_/MRDRNA2_91302_c0~~gnl/MRDRNA2_/MRDRNA2_91302_c0_seq1.p1  ORF type:complete len:126 (-),score=24.62 gnl/MRDRNA2_/MRDRNA2_91302_c0_seq1:90-467(-)
MASTPRNIDYSNSASIPPRAAEGKPPFGPPGHPQVTGLSHIAKAPKWSFQTRKPPPASLNVPGPGTYKPTQPETTSKFVSSSRFGFGSAGRELIGASLQAKQNKQKKNQTPGPGQYGGHYTVFGY